MVLVWPHAIVSSMGEKSSTDATQAQVAIAMCSSQDPLLMVLRTTRYVAARQPMLSPVHAAKASRKGTNVIGRKRKIAPGGYVNPLGPNEL